MNGAGNNYRVDFEFFAKAQGFIKTLKETQGHVGALGKLMEGPFKVTGKAVGELKNSIKEAAKVHKDWVKDSKDIQTELTNILRKQVLEYTTLTKKMKELTKVQKDRRNEVLAEMQSTKEHLNMVKEYSRSIGGTPSTLSKFASSAGGVLKQGGFLLLASSIGIAVSTALKGLSVNRSLEAPRATLAGLVGLRSYGSESRRAMSLIGMGYMPQEAMQIANMAQRQMGGGTRFLGSMSRAMGLAPGEVAGWGGQLRQLGRSFELDEHSQGARTLIKLFTLGTSKGMQGAGFEKSRVSEFINASISLARRQGQYTTGDVDPLAYARRLAFWTMSGRPGLQGTRGAYFLSQLDQTIRNPGGGDAGRAFMLMSMGFGDPTKKTSFYEAMKMMQKGASDPQNVRRMLSMLNRQYGWQEGNIVGNVLNPSISIEGWEAIRKVEMDKTLGSKIKSQRISQILEKQRMSDPVEISKKIADSLMGLTKAEARITSRLDTIGGLLKGIAIKFANLYIALMDTAIKYFKYNPQNVAKQALVNAPTALSMLGSSSQSRRELAAETLLGTVDTLSTLNKTKTLGYMLRSDQGKEFSAWWRKTAAQYATGTGRRDIPFNPREFKIGEEGKLVELFKVLLNYALGKTIKFDGQLHGSDHSGKDRKVNASMYKRGHSG